MSSVRLFSLVFLVLLLAGCGTSDQSAAPSTAADTAAAPANTITLSRAELDEIDPQTVRVALKPVITTLEFPAKVRPSANQEAYATALVSGRVEQLRASVGTRVEKGEVLAEITAPELSQMVADLRAARDALDRQQRLKERGLAVEKNVRAAKRNWEAARQHLRSIGLSAGRIKQVASGKKDLFTLPLEAPIAGTVLNRMVVLGAPVNAGSKLYHIASLQPIRVVARIFEQSLDEVRVGQSVAITTPMTDRVYEGTIDRITPQVDDKSRAATAHVVLDNSDGTLRPGMYAAMKVHQTSAVQASLPSDVLLTDDSGAYLLVREGARQFRRVYVDAQAETAGDVAVPSLKVGTEVVTKGAYQIASALNQRG
ncbi:efflux RND transporter periplasmic adaptor subunit [Salisaeta longa]|uniref:efflux RND transporter periplasmic adaptor subunit n=1 Tax=Salisaeta longa TaxID=503170 RepID=UPI00048F637C|nr:efflux RND transporter periplasmic adaptor subunit [Salisaeta longa]